jgi:hypothetical protein
MKKLTLVYAVMCATVLSSCDFKCTVGDNKQAVKTKPVTSKDNTPLNGAIIKNDIDLEVTGVKLKEAYLVDANYNLLNENVAAIGEKIYVVIKLDTGWVKEEGKSFIGAGERISTKAGGVIVDADDIFKTQGVTGMDAEDAKVISLSAVITEAKPGVDDFVVKFRVWDKKGTGDVRGKYNFSLKK